MKKMQLLFSRYPHLAVCPLALISWNGAGGRVVWRVTGWIGLVSGSPARLSFALRGDEQDFDEMRFRRDFAVNVPRSARAVFLQRQGVMQSGHAADADLSLSFVPGTIVSSPCLNDCPVIFECRVHRIQREFERVRITGDVFAVQIDGALCRDDAFSAIGRMASCLGQHESSASVAD
jgi:flavin reductase (DIM6/NTAB) family NADH-FMN oxidoreductase RutF